MKVSQLHSDKKEMESEEERNIDKRWERSERKRSQIGSTIEPKMGRGEGRINVNKCVCVCVCVCVSMTTESLWERKDTKERQR